MRHVLLALCGTTPQLLTESLYALKIRQSIPIESCWVMTTQEGRQRVISQLLHPHKGRYYTFLKEYELEKILFSEEQIVSVCQDDILYSTDHDHFSDHVTRLVQNLTADPYSVLHAVIAGGRKSMSVYFSMAMQFYARPRDRMYHLIISPATMENHQDFYYPPRQTIPLIDHAGNKLLSSAVRIQLAEMSFIRMRSQLEQMFGQIDPAFSEMVRIAQQWIEGQQAQMPLIISQREKMLYIGSDTRIKLRDFDFSVYVFFAKNSLSRPDSLSHNDRERYFVVGGKNFSAEHSKTIASIYGDPHKSITWELVQGAISRIRQQLQHKLPHAVTREPYTITRVGTYHEKRYGIGLEKTLITLN